MSKTISIARGGLSTLLLLSFALCAHAAAPIPVDMRKCPLDTVTFINPWSGSAFEVEKVATDHFWLCPGGKKKEVAGAGKAECGGPYGDLILRGTYRDNGEGTGGRTVNFIYTVIKGAPCCGWSLSEQGELELSSGKHNFRWRTARDMPRLGDYPVASIDTNYTSGPEIARVVVDPLVAMKCRLPEE
ncbi:MAG: hypothetical protein AB7G34_02920 [Hyphomicrobiales bacterium]